MAKRPASQELLPADDEEVPHVRITPLGAGQEVGRSCIILEYRDKKVMFDCGIHPALQGENSLPYLDSEDLETVDVALITHFHLDHCAAVPYLLQKTVFKGRIFMTHPTKAIYNNLLTDFAKLAASSAASGGGEGGPPLFDRKDVEASLERIEVVDFDQTIEVNGIQITPYRAGHVLGAAMFMVDIGGMRCLYTGDYSRVTDRHLPAADMPLVTPHIVIVESTYGTSLHGPREVRERTFIDKVVATVKAGGRVLIPIVAIGRAQELLLMLEEHWSRHPDLQHIKVFQASGVAKKALSVFQTYVGMMNGAIQEAVQYRNPFLFKHVSVLTAGQEFHDSEPCVMLATPSMLQSGFSRELFEAWAGNPRNTVLIVDFAVQGTLARQLLDSPQTVTTRDNRPLQVRCKVEALSFSAHADYEQTSGFLDGLQPPHVVLVHGERGEMMKLRAALERSAERQHWQRTLHTPGVTQDALIAFRPRHIATVRGKLADCPPKAGDVLRGVLVQQQGQDQVVGPEELSTFTKLAAGKVLHRQAVAINKPFSEIRLALEIMFEGVEGSGALPVKSAQSAGAGSSSNSSGAGAGGSPSAAAGGVQEECVEVGEIVRVTYRPANSQLGYETHVVLEWAGGSKGDVFADAVLAVLLQTAGEPEGAAELEQRRAEAVADGDVAAALKAELQLAGMLLGAQFGPVDVNETTGQISWAVDGESVVVDVVGGKVSCGNEALRVRVDKVRQRIHEAMKPAALDFED